MALARRLRSSRLMMPSRRERRRLLVGMSAGRRIVLIFCFSKQRAKNRSVVLYQDEVRQALSTVF